jgi:RNA polymerase sigma-70 factor (ECF subfamily)
MDAARGGDLSRLLELLAPGAVVSSDAQAVALGSPASIDNREDVASFFNGSARSALPVFLDGRPAAAWFLHGEAKVAFDFHVRDGRVERIEFRAAPEALAAVVARRDDQPR